MHSMETGQKAESCPEQMGQDSMGFCHATKSSSQLKTYGCFWNFPFNIVRPRLTVGNRNLRKQNLIRGVGEQLHQ